MARKAVIGNRAFLLPEDTSAPGSTEREFGAGALRYNATDDVVEESTLNGSTLSWHPISGWRGVWTSGRNYGKGQFVIDSADGGNIYECTSAITNSTAAPNSASSNWTKRVTVGGGGSTTTSADPSLAAVLEGIVHKRHTASQTVIDSTSSEVTDLNIPASGAVGFWLVPAIAGSPVSTDLVSWNASIYGNLSAAALNMRSYLDGSFPYGSSTWTWPSGFTTPSGSTGPSNNNGSKFIYWETSANAGAGAYANSSIVLGRGSGSNHSSVDSWLSSRNGRTVSITYCAQGSGFNLGANDGKPQLAIHTSTSANQSASQLTSGRNPVARYFGWAYATSRSAGSRLNDFRGVSFTVAAAGGWRTVTYSVPDNVRSLSITFGTGGTTDYRTDMCIRNIVLSYGTPGTSTVGSTNGLADTQPTIVLNLDDIPSRVGSTYTDNLINETGSTTNGLYVAKHSTGRFISRKATSGTADASLYMRHYSADRFDSSTTVDLTLSSSSTNITSAHVNKVVLVTTSTANRGIACDNSVGNNGDTIVFSNQTASTTFNVTARFGSHVSWGHTVIGRRLTAVKKIAGQWWHWSEYD